jgi:hypothetical protein
LAEVCTEELPPGLEELIFACLAKSQADRPASGEELADGLDRLDVARWTRADAEAWWDVFGEEVRQAKGPISPHVTDQTIAIDFEAR